MTLRQLKKEYRRELDRFGWLEYQPMTREVLTEKVKIVKKIIRIKKQISEKQPDNRNFIF